MAHFLTHGVCIKDGNELCIFLHWTAVVCTVPLYQCLNCVRDDGGFPHYDVPYGGLPPPPVAGALPPPAWMSGSGDAANKG